MSDRLSLIHLPGRGDQEMPYTPAIKVVGGSMVYFAGVTAADVYHSHPHIPAEFDAIPLDGSGQAALTVDNLEAVVAAAGGTLADIVEVTRYIVDIEENQDALNRELGSRMGAHRPASTTVEVTRLATDARLLYELKAVAVIG